MVLIRSDFDLIPSESYKKVVRSAPYLIQKIKVSVAFIGINWRFIF